MSFVLRAAVAAISASVAASALASFDLMMMTGGDGRIYRYDPVNNVQLGSFSSGTNNRLLANDDSGHLYAGNNSASAFRKYTYGNGELLGGFTGVTTAVAIHHSGGFVYLQTGGAVRKHDATTGAFISSVSLASGVNWQPGAMGRGFLYMVGQTTSNQVSLTSVNLESMFAGGIQSMGITATAGSVFGKAAVAFNDIGQVARIGFAADLGGGLSFHNALIDYANGQYTGGVVSSFGISAAGTFSSTSFVPTTMAGHSGFWVYGADATAPTTTARVTRYDMVSGIFAAGSTTFSSPGGSFAYSGNSWHATNVVAPEPGTFLALGAGALALLQRRKRAA